MTRLYRVMSADSARTMIMATMPVRNTLMIRELMIENQCTVSLQQGGNTRSGAGRGRAGGRATL